jgi:hypothetical protein
VTAILVLGSPRSGTSLVAQILHTLGVSMGPRFIPSDPDWCPSGFYTDAEFHEHHCHLTRHRFDVPAAGMARDPMRAEAYVELVRSRDAALPLWGVKDYLLPPCLALFASAAAEVKVVRTSRPHAARAASWQARTGQEAAEANWVVAGWQDAVDKSLAAFAGPVLSIDFDTLIDRPAGQVAWLATFCGRPFDPAVAALVDPSWRRF